MEIALYCRSGARSGGSRSGNGAGSGDYRIRLERGAAFSPAPLRSHALDLGLYAERNWPGLSLI